MIQLTHQHVLTYGFLSLALIALWIPISTSKRIPVQVWQIFFTAALVCGLSFGVIQLIALLPISVFGGACYYAASEHSSKPARIVAGIVMFALSICLALHIVPGFLNPLVVDNVIISEGGIPYSKHLNFDTPLVGLFVLGFTCKSLLSTRQTWGHMLKQVAPISAITIVVLILLSIILGYVRFDPKWSELFWFWAWTNLLFTCVAEETLFRGIIQRYLIAGFSKHRYGATIGLILAAVIFGLAHFPGGPKYVLLSTVAGLGYGWVYLKTQQIEAGILTHFLLNCVHFVFFTYPALETALP